MIHILKSKVTPGEPAEIGQVDRAAVAGVKNAISTTAKKPPLRQTHGGTHGSSMTATCRNVVFAGKRHEQRSMVCLKVATRLNRAHCVLCTLHHIVNVKFAPSVFWPDMLKYTHLTEVIT